MDRLLNSRHEAVVFVPIAFLFLLLYSTSTSPLYLYEGFDSATFKTIGLGIVQGKLPYTELFDHKGPLIFYADALGIWLGGLKWGIFALQTIFLSFSLWMTFRICCLFGDRRKAFFVTMLTLIPLIDFIVEGNQCEEWMLPFITASLYMALSWMKGDRPGPHPACRSLFYGISFTLLFFIRPNDAVASIGSIMLGVFILLVARKMYKNAWINALCFGIGAAVAASPICLYFIAKGIFPDMIYGMITHNIQYAGAVTFKTFGFGIVLIPMIVMGTAIFISGKDVSRFILIPCLTLTLALIGKRDYYHYLLPIIPYISIFYMICLRRRLKSVVIIVSILFLGGSFMQHKHIIKCASHSAELSELYRQTDGLFELVPENERDRIWNLNLYGAYFHAGTTPGNRIFIPFHLGYFDSSERVSAKNPQWVLLRKDTDPDEDMIFCLDNYEEVACTDGNCPAQIALYRKL